MESGKKGSIQEELDYAKNEWSSLYALMYYHLAKEFKRLGEDGEKALRRGIRNYGKARGVRLGKRHESLGLPNTMKTLFTNYDLPGDTLSKRIHLSVTLRRFGY